jgi:ABC-type nitrate/sulfonate/bicarbonate transport system permease component
MTRLRLVRNPVGPALLVIAFIAIWELFVRVAQPPRFILPAPSAIAAAFPAMVEQLAGHSVATLTIIMLGFVAGSVGGLVLAVVMSFSPMLRAGIYPIVIASQTTPKIAVAPLLLVWFGIGLLPKVLIVALLAFFPVLINTLAGLDSTDRGHLELLKSVNASRWQTYRQVRLPAAIPFVFAGLKLALTVSVIGAIIGEWIAGNQGLGFLLLFYNANLRTTQLFVVLVTLVVLATALFALLVVVERVLSWEAKTNTSTSVTTAKIAQESSL